MSTRGAVVVAVKERSSALHEHVWHQVPRLGVYKSSRFVYQACGDCGGRRVLDLYPETERKAVDLVDLAWVGGARTEAVGEMYAPIGACTTCPYAGRCHPARQRAADPFGAGRHTACGVHADFERANAARRHESAMGRVLRQILGFLQPRG